MLDGWIGRTHNKNNKIKISTKFSWTTSRQETTMKTLAKMANRLKQKLRK
jgi:hypothetical protein